MANFMGGSAPAMAAQITDGFTLLSSNTLKNFAPGELNLLKVELDKILRDARSQTPPQDDALAQAARNRKIARLNGAMQVIQNQLSQRR
jgi:hypothetical protein